VQGPELGAVPGGLCARLRVTPTPPTLVQVLDMGINIPITVKKKAGGAGAKPAGGTLTAARLDRPVVNCLACGRIFDCRAVTNDIIQFLGAQGCSCPPCGTTTPALRNCCTPACPAAGWLGGQPVVWGWPWMNGWASHDT
jgi:hypothetical protein